MPEVSVITPTYNRSFELKRAVRSVLGQSLGDLEIIVVDDGSLDVTAGALAEFDDPRIVCVQNTRGKGPAGARNTGLAHARGQFVALLDSDDEFLEHHLRDSVRALRQYPGHDFVFGRAVYFQGGVEVPYMGPGMARKIGQIVPKRHDETIPSLVIFDELLLDYLLRDGCFFNLSTVVYSRRVIDNGYIFDESCFGIEDYEYWVRLSASYRFLFLDTPQINYYLGDSSISFNNTPEKTERNFAEHTKVLRDLCTREFASPSRRRTLRARLAQEYFDHAYGVRKRGEYLRSVRLYLTALGIRPSLKTAAAAAKALSLMPVGIARAAHLAARRSIPL